MSAAKAGADLLTLNSPVTALAGVGPERAECLSRLKIDTISSLLMHAPHRYEDRRHLFTIRELKQGQAAATRGRIVAQGMKYYRQRTKSLFEIILDDGTARLHCRWWNLAFMENCFNVGDEVMVYGKANCMKPRTIDHPETEVIDPREERSIHLDRIAPIYPLTEGLTQRWMRSLMWRTLEHFESQIQEPWQGLGLSLPSRADAVRMIHFPAEMKEATIARQRLALDEFIELQLAIQRRRRTLQTHAKGLPCRGDNRLIKPFLRALGFELTGAQTRVLRELRQDLCGEFPMRRLVQGDVGSGKTVVAACCGLMALESGFSVALMAPTEILAEQHYQLFRRWFTPLGIAVELHTGSRKTLSEGLELGFTPSPGTISQRSNAPPLTLIIGTHALIESPFTMEKLGLVIIDEQHKFGVAQREKLVRKGHYPHLLVMTATPIPRTLGLTLYGDLDCSVIDELPAGRGAIRTFVRTPEKLPKVWEFIRAKLAEGRQVYVIYPRIEDSGAGSIKAVISEKEQLDKILAPYRLGVLHGRLRLEEKDAVMSAFRANHIQVLLATSVIEVGIDVPNATVMLIENAEQFGLAQLHQLRGRIGRGAHESYCILVADPKTSEARQRLGVLKQTTDGFQIADADLKLRGAGELLGQQQSGIPALRFGDFAEDLPLVERARALAAQILDATPARGPVAKHP